MFVCWSVKGGSGTTVVAASLALVLARSGPTVVVDLGGDIPAALGLPEPAGPGVHDWMVSPTADAAALGRLAVPATVDLEVVPRGLAPDPHPVESWAALAAALDRTDATVVVDAGCGVPAPPLLATASHSLLVTRSCYLALRRAAQAAVCPSGVVLLLEPGRALSARDVEQAVGAPVVAAVPYDPAVARAVDAGLLAARLPRTIAQPLKGAA